MATNNIKPFAIGNGANVTSQADYESLSALLTGFQSGKASSAQINKALRQSSFVASVLAQFISNAAGVDVLDNGNATALLNNFIAALKANGANDFLQKSSNLTDVADKTVALSTLGGAPLASPTFTGTPKGPTAAAGTNTTQFATTAFAQSLIAGLLKASNNLSEIEAAGPAAVASALANLGLGEAAKCNVGTTPGTVAAGDDPRLVGAIQKKSPTLVTAWVNFSVAGGVITINDSYNVSSVVRTATGRFNVIFTNAMKNAFYCPSVISRRPTAGTSEDGICYGLGGLNRVMSVNQFPISINNAASTAEDPPFCCVSVSGGL
ncbi:hypothetical protein [Erwinia rhapontici]|uniref:hypothetical protein n=1 Tax=Erwinia rhapontici TaxID=55212 RepID=UPI0010DEE96C|nr:hypothetical protein [Erwinia rhapontici]TDT01697.1 hypothetical protein EDF84_101424 [Erwinia rhapontici]